MFFSQPNRPKPANLETLSAALRAALDTADEGERPGLRRAIDIVEGFVAGAGPVGVEWARKVLELAGIDPRTAEVRAVKELRSARPGLGLKEAVALVKALVAQSG
jgi:NADH dehydrogenase FAD-containing subunit